MVHFSLPRARRCLNAISHLRAIPFLTHSRVPLQSHPQLASTRGHTAFDDAFENYERVSPGSEGTCADASDRTYDSVRSELFPNDEIPPGCTESCAPKICAEVCITHGNTVAHRGFVVHRMGGVPESKQCFCLYDDGMAPVDVSGWALPANITPSGGNFTVFDGETGDGPIVSIVSDGPDVDRCYRLIPVSIDFSFHLL